MSAQVFVGLSFVVALAAGLAAVRWLRTHSYRLDDEGDLPLRSHVWVAVVMPLAGVLAAAGVAGRWPWWVAVGPVLFVLCWLVAAGIDADVGRLPDVFTLPLAGLALAWGLGLAWVFASAAAAVRTVCGALAMAAIYVVLQVLSRVIPPHQEAIGSGDAKLALSIGAVLGWFSWLGVWSALLLAFVIGAVWGLALLVTRRAGRRDSFSFGPAMVLGAALALVVA